MSAPLGIIAGAGNLPRLIAEVRQAEGSDYLVCCFEAHVPDWVAGHPAVTVPFEKPGRLLSALRARGIAHLVLAGGLVRPRLRPLHFDRLAMTLAPRLVPLLGRGDDALLRGLGAVLEAEGFELVPPQAVLADLAAPAGPIAGPAPDEAVRADIARAAALVAALGAADVGQGAVVEAGQCLGLETLQGTDAMLGFVAATDPALRAPHGGVLYKAPKPAQDRRLDLPAIGVETLRSAARAGLSGVAVAAGGVLIIDRPAVQAEAAALGLFVFGWEAP